MAKILVALVVAAVSQFAAAWLLMLLVGVVHARWFTTLPTIGYWVALAICALLAAVRFNGAVAVAVIKVVTGTDKPATARKTAPRQDPLPPVGSTVRFHRVNPETFKRGLL